MQFEWDEAKRQANRRKHGIDFVIARRLFDGRPLLLRAQLVRGRRAVDQHRAAGRAVYHGRLDDAPGSVAAHLSKEVTR